MIPLPRLGARLLAAALALTLLPAYVHADDALPPPHPWKLAIAKRMADERFEHREALEKRMEALRRQAREQKRAAKRAAQAKRRGGVNAKPAQPDDSLTPATEFSTPARRAQPFGARAFVPPSNRIVNNRAGEAASTGQSETSIVAVGNRMVAAWNDGQGFQVVGDRQGWGTSVDGGQTWTDQGSLPHPAGLTSFLWTSDPCLAVNEKTGAVYFAALCSYFSGSSIRDGVGVVKGRWNGNTFVWGAPVIARDVDDNVDFLDKEWIVADSVTNRVHLVYTRFPAQGSVIDYQFADSGLTAFSTPQQISQNIVTENGWVQGARPIVDGTGRVYVMYYLIGQQEEDFYRVRRSDDGGVSFNAPVTAQAVYTNFGSGSPGFNRESGVQFAGLAVDRSHGANRGRLYLSWAESLNWLDDVFTIGKNGNKSEVESNGTAATANAASLGQTLRGSLSAFSDVDYFTLPLVAGQHIILAADSAGSGVMGLRLIGTDGVTRLAFTTFDPGVNPSAQAPNGSPSGFTFTAPATGTYYVRVATKDNFFDGGFGAYRIRTGLADRTTERGRDQRDIFVSWSDDGSSWSTPAALSDDPIGFDAFLPEVAVAADGGVYSAWYDFRDSDPSTNGGLSSVYLARSGDGGVNWTTLGAVTDTLTNWSTTQTNLMPNQGDYIALFANDTGVWPCWADGRRGNPDVFTAKVPLIPNGALVSFSAIRLGNRRISIDWTIQPADTLVMRLYRSVDQGAFAYLDVVQFAPDGTLSYTDTTVTGGHAYAYRLGRFSNSVELFYGLASTFLPSSFQLALSTPWPNPVTGATFVANFMLATNEPADLILFDITGREVYRRSLSPGQGPQSLTLPVGPELKQGMYVLTLRQGGHNASTRVHLLR